MEKENDKDNFIALAILVNLLLYMYLTVIAIIAYNTGVLVIYKNAPWNKL